MSALAIRRANDYFCSVHGLSLAPVQRKLAGVFSFQTACRRST